MASKKLDTLMLMAYSFHPRMSRQVRGVVGCGKEGGSSNASEPADPASPALVPPPPTHPTQILFISDNFEKLKELTQAFARVGGHAQMDLIYADMDVEECLGTKNCEAFQQFNVAFSRKQVLPLVVEAYREAGVSLVPDRDDDGFYSDPTGKLVVPGK